LRPAFLRVGAAHYVLADNFGHIFVIIL